jgi:hypothetical protein
MGITKRQGEQGMGEQVPEYCVISWWRGYVRSRFYAQSDRAAIVGESRTFRWSRNVPPPREKKRARKAHEQLVERLIRAGWEPFEQGPNWYELGLERPRQRPAPLSRGDGDTSGASERARAEARDSHS